jgi:pyruvate carboxylase
VALCYTGDLLDPAEKLYTLDYYLELAQKIVDAGAHILAIKDMAGLLRPAAAAKLVAALRERFDLPVHLHTHDTAGGQLATLLAAVDAGVDAVDVASASLAGTTSQPSASALVAALAPTPPGHRPEPGRRQFPRAVLGSRAPCLRPVRVRPSGPHRPGLQARDSRRPALQPPAAGHGSRPGRAV